MNRIVCYIGVGLITVAGFRSACGQTRPEPAQLNPATWPAGVVAKSDLPKNNAYEYKFSEVQTSTIESWLSLVRVTIPVKVSGSLSGWVWAQRSEQGWFNFSGYRIEGQIVSPNLQVEQWIFKDAVLRFGFANNVWYVGRLSGDVSSTGEDAIIGEANFAATMPTDGDRLLQISGGISQAQLKPLLKALDVDFEIANENGNVQANANVPLALAREPAAWKLKASVDLAGVRSIDIPRSSLASEIDVIDGKWQIPSGTLTIIDQPIAFNGSGTLDARFPYTASIAGRQLSIGQLLKAARQPELVSRLSGTIDVAGKVRGSRERVVEAVSLAVRSQSIVIDGEELQGVRAESVFDNRTDGQESLKLDVKSMAYAGGAIQGTVGWDSLRSLQQLFPNQAELQVQALDLARIPSLLAGVGLNGIANGQVKIASRLNADEKSHKWSTDSQLTVNNLSILNSAFGNTSLSLYKAIDSEKLKGTLKTSDQSLQAAVELDISDSLEGGVMDGIRSYSATGSVAAFNFVLPLGMNGKAIPLIATGQFALRGTPENWLSTGSVELEQLNLQLPEQSVELTNLVANIREDAYRLERFQVRDSNAGQVAGSAIIRRDRLGEHVLNLRIVDLEIEPYVINFAPARLQGLTGTVNFETRLQKTATSADYLSGWTGSIEGNVLNVEYRSTPIGELAIDGQLSADQIAANVSGSVLGGELAMDAAFPPDIFTQPAADQRNLPISATFTGLSLQRLMSVVMGPRLGARYSGIANLQVESTEQTGEWQVRMGVPSFYFGRQELAKELSASLIYRNQVVVVENFAGRLAGGRVNLRGEIQTKSADPSGRLRYSADQLNVQSLAIMFFPTYAQNFSGSVSSRGYIQVGREIVLTGNSHFKNALVYSVPLQDLRNELSISISLSGGLKEISARNIHGVAVGGRFDGEANVRGGARYSFDATGRIGGGKLDQLSRALGFEKIVGTGNFDASTRLTSRDATSLAALSGPLQLDFTSGDVKSVPVLSDLGRLVPVVQLASSNIQSGTMRGQFGQGQFRFPVLLLNSDAFYLIAGGGTSLSSGGIDVDGLLQTGGNLNNQLTQGATQRLVSSAFPQLLLLTQINDLVRNRTIYFHVGGTPKHPSVQPKAAQTVARGLLQNFRRNLIAIPTASAAISNSNNN